MSDHGGGHGGGDHGGGGGHGGHGGGGGGSAEFSKNPFQSFVKESWSIPYEAAKTVVNVPKFVEGGGKVVKTLLADTIWAVIYGFAPKGGGGGGGHGGGHDGGHH